MAITETEPVGRRVPAHGGHEDRLGRPGRPGLGISSSGELVDLASRRFDTSLHDASRRVCRAMLLLAPLRESGSPEMRAAYENIHDVMGDLATMYHWATIVSQTRDEH